MFDNTRVVSSCSRNQQLTVLDRNECQSQEIISTETEIHRYFPLITNPHNAGICVGLCRYLRWAMQVSALGYAGICIEHAGICDDFDWKLQQVGIEIEIQVRSLFYHWQRGQTTRLCLCTKS